MNNMTNEQKKSVAFNRAKFSLGQLVSHLLFDYRGVIIDIDPVYSRSEEWYNQVALTKPPKDKPWYRVLVHDATHETYVSERNLQADTSAKPVEHPLVNNYFNEFNGESYITSRQIN